MATTRISTELNQIAALRTGSWAALEFGERLAAAAALFLLLPVVAIVAAVILVLSRRSPFVAHLRVGVHGEPLWMLKFRTMWPRKGEAGAQLRWVEYVAAEPGREPKPADDPRVTSVFARALRRFSVDELPQLLHVAEGRMSLVGPRPLTRAELVEHYGDRCAEILRMKPGITGLWQVKGRNRLSYRQRARFDLLYVRAHSTALYLYVLWLTIPCVVLGKDSW